MNVSSQSKVVRLHQVDTFKIYAPCIFLVLPTLLGPAISIVGFDLFLYTILVAAAFFFIFVIERRWPSFLLCSFVSLPIYLGSVLLYTSVLYCLVVLEEMSTFYKFLAVVSGMGKVISDIIIIRKLTPEIAVCSLIDGKRVTMSRRGIVISLPWASDLFSSFSRGEAILIWSVRSVLCATWAWAFFRYGPVMYSSVGIMERFPHMIALSGFPIAFFFNPFWQTPFMYYCHKHADQLVDAAEKQRRRDEKAKQNGDNEAPEWKWM